MAIKLGAILAGAALAAMVAVPANVASAETANPARGAKQAIAQDGAAPVPRSGCSTRGFLVNDYGKDGPTKDAKSLLDKDIASWAQKNGIAKYKTGAKAVSCEKYLDFGFFDEWTCTASAKVCW